MITIANVSSSALSFFGQSVAANASIQVSESVVDLAAKGVGPYAQDFKNLLVSADRGLVTVAALGTTYSSSVGLETALSTMLQTLVASQLGSDSVDIKLTDWRIVSSGGDVGDTTANGGLLSSNTAPLLRGDANESQEIVWAASGVVALQCSFPVPLNMDLTQDARLELDVLTDNAGGGGIDAASFGVECSFDGATQVADTATDGTPATTSHTISATIAAADMPDTARRITIAITPAAHGNDPIALELSKLVYKKKLVTS